MVTLQLTAHALPKWRSIFRGQIISYAKQFPDFGVAVVSAMAVADSVVSTIRRIRRRNQQVLHVNPVVDLSWQARQVVADLPP